MKRILFCTALLALGACEQQNPSQDAPSLATGSAPETTGHERPASETASATDETRASSATGNSPLPQRLTQQVPLMPPSARTEKPRQVAIYTPPVGSVERVELMNALRHRVRSELGGEATFVVSELRSNGQWAFAVTEPQWRDGRSIRLEHTPLYRSNPDQPIDGLRTEVIWKNDNGRWRVYQYVIGATDVWWLEYCDRVPRRILRGC